MCSDEMSALIWSLESFASAIIYFLPCLFCTIIAATSASAEYPCTSTGSGAIASAYSRAFADGLPITFVSGRSVGIGAYLARLGRRCIQRADQPMILTGYAALNKLLGREVYTSHMQLGGPKVIRLTSHIKTCVLKTVIPILCKAHWAYNLQLAQNLPWVSICIKAVCAQIGTCKLKPCCTWTGHGSEWSEPRGCCWWSGRSNCNFAVVKHYASSAWILPSLATHFRSFGPLHCLLSCKQ